MPEGVDSTCPSYPTLTECSCQESLSQSRLRLLLPPTVRLSILHEIDHLAAGHNNPRFLVVLVSFEEDPLFRCPLSADEDRAHLGPSLRPIPKDYETVIVADVTAEATVSVFLG